MRMMHRVIRDRMLTLLPDDKYAERCLAFGIWDKQTMSEWRCKLIEKDYGKRLKGTLWSLHSLAKRLPLVILKEHMKRKH